MVFSKRNMFAFLKYIYLLDHTYHKCHLDFFGHLSCSVGGRTAAKTLVIIFWV